MSTPSDDAQRALEQRALRNVRDLVDKVEGIDAEEKRRQRRMLAGLVIVAIVVAVAFGALLATRSGTPAGKTITIESPKR